MSDTTGIEWTDATWNPTTGCTKVSPGCDHCYAKTMYERFNGKDSFETVTLHPDRLTKPLSWRKPKKVFVNSMSDLFHQDVPDHFIAEVFAIMSAGHHIYQVLTKRHARMRSLLGDPEFRATVEGLRNGPLWQIPGEMEWPLRNVWLGVSVENQQWADIRIPALIDTPAAVRFLSCEPLLGPVDLFGKADQHGARSRLTYWLDGRPGWSKGGEPVGDSGLTLHSMETGPRIDWVIAGGESGPGSRPMHPDWARTLRDQCVSAGVPYLFKQWGAFRPPIDGDESGALMTRVGKKAAGRELDGRTWDQYPVSP